MYIFYSFQKYGILSDADSIKKKQNAKMKKLRKKEM